MTHHFARDALGQSLVDQDLVVMPDGAVLRFHKPDVMFPIRVRLTGDPGDLYESLYPSWIDISKAIRVDVTLDDLWGHLWEYLTVRDVAFGWSNNDLHHAAKRWHERRSA